ncbi:MAG: hypothetical protein ACNI27_11025 [Desulfovibrio sp.]
MNKTTQRNIQTLKGNGNNIQLATKLGLHYRSWRRQKNQTLKPQTHIIITEKVRNLRLRQTIRHLLKNNIITETQLRRAAKAATQTYR